MSKLLIQEPPLQVLPGLAMAIKVSPALALQQLHFRLLVSEYRKAGKTWLPRSIDDWVEKDFPFWQPITVIRTFEKLESLLLIERTSMWNNTPTDRTLWYTIDYEQVDLLSQQIDQMKQARKLKKLGKQNDQMILEDLDQEEEIEEDSDSFFFSSDDLPDPVNHRAPARPRIALPPIDPLLNGRNVTEVWNIAFGQLALSLPRDPFDTWVRGLVLLHHSGGVFTFDARNKYAKAWLDESSLQDVIVRTLKQVAGCDVEVRFVLASDYGSSGEGSS